MSDSVSIDLNDLDDDLLEAANDFDLILSNSDQELPTLESILNENDDLENDEILKTLTSTLTIIEPKKTLSKSRPLAGKLHPEALLLALIINLTI